MEKLRHVEFWKAAQQVPTASWGAELLVEARAFLGPAHRFISRPSLRPSVPKDRENGGFPAFSESLHLLSKRS